MNIHEAQITWRVLDGPDFEVPKGIRLISHEFYDEKYTEGILPVTLVPQGRLSRFFSFFKIVAQLIWAFEILQGADDHTVIIVNGSTQFGNYICLLNYYLFSRTRIILFWDSHIEPTSRIKKYFARRCFMGCSLATLWARKQPSLYANFFNLAEDKFIFIPYKSTHSKLPPRSLLPCEYVFSGGNTRRDYKTLVEAVKDTDVFVVVSTNDRSNVADIPDIPNVVVVSSVEPSFSKLMAASLFVVVPMLKTGIRGAGETTYCNAMWHSKPVIAMDDSSSLDYILDGETGYIVPPGDATLLRTRILELWEDRAKVHKMGEKGHQFVASSHTQILGIRRLVRLACLVGKEKILDRNNESLSS